MKNPREMREKRGRGNPVGGNLCLWLAVVVSPVAMGTIELLMEVFGWASMAKD